MNIAVNRRSLLAGAGALLEFKRHHPRAFAKHQAVATTIERARRLRRTVVEMRRHGAHTREPEDHAGQHAPIGAA